MNVHLQQCSVPIGLLSSHFLHVSGHSACAIIPDSSLKFSLKNLVWSNSVKKIHFIRLGQDSRPCLPISIRPKKLMRVGPFQVRSTVKKSSSKSFIIDGFLLIHLIAIVRISNYRYASMYLLSERYRSVLRIRIRDPVPFC